MKGHDMIRSDSGRAPHPRHTLTAAAGALLTVVLALSGCTPSAPAGTGSSAPATEAAAAGDIPDNQQYVPFTGGSGDYSITVPEGWSRADQQSRAVFTDKLNSIGLEETGAPTSPTVASTKADAVPALQKSEPKFSLSGVEAFTRKGGSGVLIRYLADSPADPVTNKVVRDSVELYLFWKNGKEVAVRLAAAQGADNVDPWKIVTDSFTWLR
jgi:hypothetical protein